MFSRLHPGWLGKRDLGLGVAGRIKYRREEEDRGYTHKERQQYSITSTGSSETLLVFQVLPYSMPHSFKHTYSKSHSSPFIRHWNKTLFCFDSSSWFCCALCKVWLAKVLTGQLFYSIYSLASLSFYSITVIEHNTEIKNLACSATETLLSWRLGAFLLHMRPFSLHVDFKQNLSLAVAQTREQKKALTAKKHPLNG